MNLKEVELSNIERIEEYAFGKCRSLKQIVLPATVNYVGKEAFKDCESLETVLFTSNGCKIEDHIFEGCQALKKVVLPASYAYRNLGNLWGGTTHRWLTASWNSCHRLYLESSSRWRLSKFSTGA